MENKDTEKVRFTLRLPIGIHKKVEKKAKNLGISQNELISTILHKEINKKR